MAAPLQPVGASEAAIAAAKESRPDKAPGAFRTIREVADELGVPQHVLRFWESRFGQVRPLKRAGGRRYYRPEDVELLRRIQNLLHQDGYTIRGVQKLFREGGVKAVRGAATAAVPVASAPAGTPARDGGAGRPSADSAGITATRADAADAIVAPRDAGALEARRGQPVDAPTRERLEGLVHELEDLLSLLRGALSN
jgi:DNA-binding transcriptional MerR regulator